MKNFSIFGYLSLLFCFLFFNCSDNSTGSNDGITAKPVVKVSSTNYNYQTFTSRFPDTLSLKKISDAYSNNYSESIKENMIEYMKTEVKRLNEDVNIFNNIVSLSGCNTMDEYVLPTYSEKAFYEDHEAWIIQITYGLGEPNFEHFKFLVDDGIHFIDCSESLFFGFFQINRN